MTPAKKATPAKSVPSLSELTGKKDDGNHPETEVETPVPVTGIAVPPAVEDEPVESNTSTAATDYPNNEDLVAPGDEGADASDEYAKPIEPGEDHVTKWQENQNQNLGRVHPDVHIQGKPSEHAGVQVVSSVTQYAGTAELDDKGIVGPDEEDDSDSDEESDSEFAPENKNDDKNIVSGR